MPPKKAAKRAARKSLAKKHTRKSRKHSVPKQKKPLVKTAKALSTPEEIISEVRNEKIFLAGHKSRAEDENIILIKKRDILQERVQELKSGMNEANERIITLAEEIAKRNSNLKLLSDAYIEVKENYDSMKANISKFKSDIASRDSTIQSLKSVIEKYKKQIMRTNPHIETLYKRLTQSQIKERQIAIINNKLNKQCDILIEDTKKKDMELTQKDEEAKNLVEKERSRITLDAEKQITDYLQKEMFLKKKIAHINKQLMEKDSIITQKDKKISMLNGIYRKIKDFIETGNIVTGKAATAKKRIFPSFVRKTVPEKPIQLFPEEEQEKGQLQGIEEKGFETEPIVIEKTAPAEETLPYTADEIVPIVIVALQHGDSHATIKNSLISSGYNPVEVNKAVEKVKEKSAA